MKIPIKMIQKPMHQWCKCWKHCRWFRKYYVKNNFDLNIDMKALVAVL